MTAQTTQTTDRVDPRAALAQRLAGDPDGVLEALAREYGVTMLEATRCLPEANRRFASAESFGDVMGELTTWGDIVFIVHTQNIVLECKGPVPPGSFARGYYNIHGESPIGGHIKADRCGGIALVRRPFMKRESCSIQFFDVDGEVMFKIFVGRDAERNLLADQVKLFEALWARLSA